MSKKKKKENPTFCGNCSCITNRCRCQKVNRYCSKFFCGYGESCQRKQEYGSCEVPIAIFLYDLETTGFERDSDIIDLSFVHLDSREFFNRKVSPGTSNSKNTEKKDSHNFSLKSIVSKKSRITKADLEGKPSFAVAGKELLEWLSGYCQAKKRYSFFIAHNGKSFDQHNTYWKTNCKLVGLELPAEWKFVDSIPIIKKLSNGVSASSKLEDLAQTMLGKSVCHHQLERKWVRKWLTFYYTCLSKGPTRRVAASSESSGKS